MNNKTRKNNSAFFSGIHKYYARYRPDIPKEVINIIVKYFNIGPADRILDIGCGTGQVAIAMEDRCGEMICLDSDREMLNWAKKATKYLKTKFSWFNYGAQDIGKIKKKLGVFKLTTICRGFHWMNQKQLLNDLSDLINEDGGVAIFSDGSFWTGQEEWQKTIKKIIQKYLGEERHAGKEKFKKSNESWKNILARSEFRFIETREVLVIRNWNIERIIGYLFSTSFAAPHLFGNKLNSFKKEIKNALLSINPKGVFKENAIWSIVLGSKRSRE